MHQKDSVFWVTLVDFLLQIIFFGVFVAAVVAVAKKPGLTEEEMADARKALAMTGSGTFKELTDRLTRLGPLGQAQQSVDTVKAAGGIAAVRDQRQLQAGIQRENDALAKENQRLRGRDKPSCLAAGPDDTVRYLADVRLFNDQVEFIRETPELSALLSRMRVTYNSVEELSLPQFVDTFRVVTDRLEPGCRYHVRVHMVTDKSAPLLTLQQRFYTQVIRGE